MSTSQFNFLINFLIMIILFYLLLNSWE